MQAAMPRPLVVAAALVCFFAIVVLCTYRFDSWTGLDTMGSYDQGRYGRPSPSVWRPRWPRPHHSSWNSWWYPDRIGISEKNGDEWNIFYHLGGNGPWIENVNGVAGEEIGPPEGCTVEQVHMVSYGSI